MRSGKLLWPATALFWFFIAALMGLTLRASEVISIPFNYRNLLHAHSHLEFLGWVFTAITGLLIHSFVEEEKQRNYFKPYLIITTTNAGMLISYLLFGYNWSSIAFSGIHMAASIWIVLSLRKDISVSSQNFQKPLCLNLFSAAAFFMIIASAGPLSLPLISKINGPGTTLYHNAIYFYLHFQYNGWFTFALLSIFVKTLNDSGITIPKEKAKVFIALLFLACIFSYWLSVLWSGPATISWILANTGALLSLLVLAPLVSVLRDLIPEVRKNISPSQKILLAAAFTAFTLKTILQGVSGIPGVVAFYSQSRDLIIAYLHLYLLGFVSIMLFYLYSVKKVLDFDRSLSRAVMFIFLSAFAVTELIIAGKGISLIDQSSNILTSTTIMLALSAGGIFFTFIRSSIRSIRTNNQTLILNQS